MGSPIFVGQLGDSLLRLGLTMGSELRIWFRPFKLPGFGFSKLPEILWLGFKPLWEFPPCGGTIFLLQGAGSKRFTLSKFQRIGGVFPQRRFFSFVGHRFKPSFWTQQGGGVSTAAWKIGV